jgi:hypothetical protein
MCLELSALLSADREAPALVPIVTRPSADRGGPMGDQLAATHYVGSLMEYFDFYNAARTHQALD